MLHANDTLEVVPHLYEQEEQDDPLIYAVIATADHTWACYIAEAEQRNGGYEIFGLFVSKKLGYNWAQLPLTDVEDDLKTAGLEARIEPNVPPRRASELTGVKRRHNQLPVQAHLA
jgi:hypothetical protein